MGKIIYKSAYTNSSVEIGPDSFNDCYILGIESSCDETSCAIVKNGREVLSNVVASQIKTHKKYAGVVPEIAAREHLEAINIVIEESIEKAKIKAKDLTAISVTAGPGLVGSLIVGFNAAKALALALDKPFIGINHLNAHVCANYIDSELKPPFLALLVSGGHTQIIKVKSYQEQEIIGETIDDATGEAYDKVARLLDLEYPGGPNLDKLAQRGNPDAYKLPKAKLSNPYDFSFSGLKTAVLNIVNRLNEEKIEYKREDIASSFQNCIVSTLYEKTLKALESNKIGTLVLAGGVAANSQIRQRFFGLRNAGYRVFVPKMEYCTDNAAMVASCAYFSQSNMTTLDLEVFSRC